MLLPPSSKSVATVATVAKVGAGNANPPQGRDHAHDEATGDVYRPNAGSRDPFAPRDRLRSTAPVTDGRLMPEPIRVVDDPSNWHEVERCACGEIGMFGVDWSLRAPERASWLCSPCRRAGGGGA